MGLKNASEKRGGRQARVEYEFKMALTDPEGLPSASPARPEHCFRPFQVDENFGGRPVLPLWVFLGGRRQGPKVRKQYKINIQKNTRKKQNQGAKVSHRKTKAKEIQKKIALFGSCLRRYFRVGSSFEA